MATLLLLALTACLSTDLRAAAVAEVEDASALVQSRVVQATSRPRDEDEDENEDDSDTLILSKRREAGEAEKAVSEVAVTIMANLTNNKVGKCLNCWETGFALKCRGKVLKFTFEPTLDKARVVNKFPSQHIGWTPSKGIYHNLTVVLRSSGEHTFAIQDGDDPTKTWSKDFRRKKMFPTTEAQLQKCKLRTVRKNKKLNVVGPSGVQCYGRNKNGLNQQHCLYLAGNPVRRTSTYTGTFAPPPPPTYLCYGKGDPHYKPYQGGKFNFQGNGTYVLSRIPTGPFKHVLQAFNCPVKATMKRGKLVQKKVSQAVGVAFLLDGHKFQFFNGSVKVDGGEPEPYGCRMPVGATKLKMDVSDRNLIVDGETGNGMYVEIKVTMRGSIRTSRFSYVLDVYSTVPVAAFDEEPAVTGLCAGKSTRCENTFVPWDAPGNLFLEEDAQAMEEACCGEGGCASPCVGGETQDPTLEEICAAAEPEDGRKVTVDEALLACEECGDDDAAVEACAMDYCEDPDDGDAIIMEACDVPDEEFPEIPINPQGNPGGKADPHCRNVLGEAFDVLAVGQLDFLKVPRLGPQAQVGTDLRVQALIEPISSSHPCVPTVIKQLEVSGRWLQLNGEEPLIISPGPNGSPVVPQAWAAQMNRGRGPSRNSSEPRLRSWDWQKGVTLSLVVGGIDMQINQRIGTKSRVAYLDVKFHGLERLGEKAGGLLGLDSHDGVTKPLPGCGPHDPKQPRVALQEEAEEVDLGAPGLLSVALATDSELSSDFGLEDGE